MVDDSGNIASQSPAPSASAASIISLKNAEQNFDTYFSTEGTFEGVVIDLIPASFFNPQFNLGNEIQIEDTQDHAYMASIANIDATTFNGTNLGDIVDIKGLLRGGGGAQARFIAADGDPITVGHSSQIPSVASVLSEAQALVQAHQADIQNAMQAVDGSTSFKQCAQVNDTLIAYLCSTVGTCFYNSTSLPYVYKDSTAVINNAVMGVVSACMQKFLSN